MHVCCYWAKPRLDPDNRAPITTKKSLSGAVVQPTVGQQSATLVYKIRTCRKVSFLEDVFALLICIYRIRGRCFRLYYDGF